MVSDAADLESRVFQLSPSEQFHLYTRLRDKFDPVPTETHEDLEAAWDAEIERRVQEVTEGKSVLFTMEDVNARIDALRTRLRNPA